MRPRSILPYQVMAKPNGPRCNLACSYCYYLEKETLFPDTRKFQMSDDILEAFIRDYIGSHDRLGLEEISFSWQGGEPTILGVDYFQRVVELEKKYCPAGKTIANAIQTNGILIDEKWAAFLKENHFLVGLSIDGPQELHDRFRLDRKGGPTFDKVMAALGLLQEHKVPVNALTVINSHNAQKPKEVYRFLRDAGFEFIQFIPVVERCPSGGELLAGDPQLQFGTAIVTSWSVTANDYGRFLVEVFDDWLKADVGKVFVQFFDVQLGLWMGEPAGLCWFSPTCGQGLALEHNGDVFSCDHYVYPEYRIGNIQQTALSDLASSESQRRFGSNKLSSLPSCCRDCTYRFACHGGCPKHRFMKASNGESGLNYFCAAYKLFFDHAGPTLQLMAQMIKKNEHSQGTKTSRNRPAPEVKASVGRNSPCPCGSGKKFKYCCTA